MSNIEKSITTEEKIIKAAEEVFLESGYVGARMQTIANKAEINKAMLHYYFRSKDLLFEKIFEEKIKTFFPQISEQLRGETNFILKVEIFIEQYLQLLAKYPFLPLFIISTVNNPEKKQFIDKLPVELLKEIFIDGYFESYSAGKIKEINPMQFALSVISMCVFPFLMRPVIQEKFGSDPAMFDFLIQQRIEELKKYVRLILEP